MLDCLSLPCRARTLDNRGTDHHGCGRPVPPGCQSSGAAGSWAVPFGLAAGRGVRMAAMKPRTGDGPLEVTKEGRGIVMRVPLEGGGRLVVELSATEAAALGDALKSATG